MANKEVYDYIKNNFTVMEHEEYYHAISKDFRKFIRLRWVKEANFPSIEIYTCYNGSTIETSKLIGYPNAKDSKVFKSEFKRVYIKEYGILRWIGRQIFKPFFKYLKYKESPYYA